MKRIDKDFAEQIRGSVNLNSVFSLPSAYKDTSNYGYCTDIRNCSTDSAINGKSIPWVFETSEKH